MKKIFVLLVATAIFFMGCTEIQNSGDSFENHNSVESESISNEELIISDYVLGLTSEESSPIEAMDNYEWLYNELYLRNCKITKIESEGGGFLGRPGVVVCLADWNTDGEKEILVGEWNISTTVSTITYTMYNSSGKDILGDTFTVSVDAKQELINHKKYIAMNGDEYFWQVNQAAGVTEVARIYYLDNWKMEKHQYDSLEIKLIAPADQSNLVESFITQIYSDKDIDALMLDISKLM